MAKRKKAESKWCYRTDCNCLDPAVYTEFDTEEEAEEHIRKDHPDKKMILLVPVERADCGHPRHTKMSEGSDQQAELTKKVSAKKKKAIMEQRRAVSAANEKLNKLIDNCSHVLVKHGESAVCWVCGKDFGWWCPKSPDHKCRYEENEWCDFCGEPSERL